MCFETLNIIAAVTIPSMKTLKRYLLLQCSCLNFYVWKLWFVATVSVERLKLKTLVVATVSIERLKLKTLVVAPISNVVEYVLQLF